MAGKMMVRILFKIYRLQCSICQNIYSKDYNFCILAHSSFTFRKKTSRSAAGTSTALGRDDGKLSPSMNKSSFYFLCLYSLVSLFL